MNIINNLVTCKYSKCNKYYILPVRLPCQNSICKSHIQDLLISNENESSKLMKCEFCNEVHKIPEEGFDLNRDLVELLYSDLYLSAKQKQCKESFNKLQLNKKGESHLKRLQQHQKYTYQ